MEELFSESKADSIDSFYSKVVRNLSISQKRLVLKQVMQLGEACDRDIAQYTGLSLSIVPDRRAALLKEGLIKISSRRKCPQTGKMVVYYEAV